MALIKARLSLHAHALIDRALGIAVASKSMQTFRATPTEILGGRHLLLLLLLDDLLHVQETEIARCLSFLSLVWITIMLSPKRSVVRWSTGVPHLQNPA